MASRDLTTAIYKKYKIKVGSRKSQLALLQTEEVIRCLRSFDPELEFEILTYSTKGDEILGTSLSKIGEKSLFTKELDTALQRHEVDFVVHSLKDVSSHMPPGLTLGAICEREWPGDAVLFSPKFAHCDNLSHLPAGSVVGTSSLRRTALVFHHYPDLRTESVRGNLNTRMAKLEDPQGRYAALILANCGVKRMGMSHKIKQTLDPGVWPPAVGQGSLAVECRLDDSATLDLLSLIADDAATWMAIAERSFMARLEGGCSVPLGVHCSELRSDDGDKLILRGYVYSTGPDAKCLTAVSSVKTPSSLASSNGVDGNSVVDGDHVHSVACQNGSGEGAGSVFSGIYVPKVKENVAQSVHDLGIYVADELLSMGAGEVLKAERAKNAQS